MEGVCVCEGNNSISFGVGGERASGQLSRGWYYSI